MKNERANTMFKKYRAYGGDCTAKTQMFIFDGMAKQIIEKYADEQISKAIRTVKRRANVNGIKGLCAKADVIKILEDIKKEDFELP